MTDRIEFRDEEFSFRHDRTTYHVHTVVGDNKPARVVVEEIAQGEEQPMEQSDD